MVLRQRCEASRFPQFALPRFAGRTVLPEKQLASIDATETVKPARTSMFTRSFRLTTTLLHGLRARGGRYGLATLCVGGGQGMAVIYERLA